MIACLVSSFLLQQSSATRLANHWKVFGPRASRKRFPIPIQRHRPKLQNPFTHAYWSSLNASQTEMFPLQLFSQIYWSFEEIDGLWNGIPSITFQSTPSPKSIRPTYSAFWGGFHIIRSINHKKLKFLYFFLSSAADIKFMHTTHIICIRYSQSKRTFFFADEALSTTFQSFINSAAATAAVDFLIRFSFVELCTHQSSRPLNARRPTMKKVCNLFLHPSPFLLLWMILMVLYSYKRPSYVCLLSD